MRTDELEAGTLVRVHGRIVRTVAEVVDSGWLNSRNQTIWTVRYAEGDTAEWGAGNTAVASTEWEVVCRRCAGTGAEDVDWRGNRTEDCYSCSGTGQAA